jgi:hypothetical protein
VWYRPIVSDFIHSGMVTIDSQPLDATVVAAHGDRCVNLVIFDAVGEKHVRQSVTLMQEGDAPPVDRGYAEWMPYQAKAAARDPALDQLARSVQGNAVQNLQAGLVPHPLKAGIVPLDNNGFPIQTPPAPHV